MAIDPFWQVTIGGIIGGLILSLYRLYKEYINESKSDGETQKLASASIIVGASGIVFMGMTSILGLIFGLIAVSRKKNTALAKIGIVVSIATAIPWILVIIFGA